MLTRLEIAMGRHDLIEQMVLRPEPRFPDFKKAKSAKSVNFIVGYNSSSKSQTALDITLWMAHQTRLATSKEVTVQVVYVVDEARSNPPKNLCNFAEENNSLIHQQQWGLNEVTANQCAAPTLTLPLAENQSGRSRTTFLDPSYFQAIFCQNNQFEQADKLLWQARCLADEWRGLFKAHLRFGSVGSELRQVVESETATLLFLGCNSVNHPLVRELGSDFPCSVLGIPSMLYSHGDFYSEEAANQLMFETAVSLH